MDFAMDLAEKEDRLVTVGIKPTEPATGYGYIKYNKRIDEIAHRVGSVSQKRITAYPVSDFVEKPSLPIAKSYVEQGCYLWNSGMFLWKTSVILKYFVMIRRQYTHNAVPIFFPNGYSRIADTGRRISCRRFRQYPVFRQSVEQRYAGWHAEKADECG